MKKVIGIFMLLAAFACQEEDASPTAPINDMFDPDNATIKGAGEFIGVNHTVSGTVKLYTDMGTSSVLVFDPFMAQNGPDLKVYFSQDEKASVYIKLGVLKSTTGKQSYEIPAGTNVAAYPYVHIWCEKYSVEFARAKLE